MEHYQNLSGSSGVIGYVLGEDSITVYFKDGSAYLYTNSSAGSNNITQMKKLAKDGIGLNSYINTNVKKLYARKIR